MFVQVIRGKVRDADAFRAANDTWEKELKSGAKGYLGSTSGVADDGTGVIVARFDSQAQARANSERPEQSEWWNNTASKIWDGEVTFLDFSDVELSAGGGSDEAGFVQLMFGKVKDVAADKELARRLEAQMKSVRPDVIGGVNCYTPDGQFVAVLYFTSEAEAREGEKKEMPAEMQDAMENVEGEVEFVDLRNPRFDSA
jgi:hypothetical protein